MTRQPSKSARDKVRAMFDPEMLAEMCTTWNFESYAKKVTLPNGSDGRERFYWHADNGSNVLAVAHLDTVQDDRSCQVVETAAGLLATSGALDDRLGVYVILDLLPKLGLQFDVLLTTDEERGQSTANEFDTDKRYDWIIQFDRGGTDVVMYDYETRELCELIAACGATVGNGSFSDICELGHLRCAGFNWGVGYRDYHSARSHAWLEDTFRMVARFVKFHRANGTRRFDHEPWIGAWWNDDVALDDLGGDMPIEDECWIEADCGHDVDIANSSDYVEMDGGYVICNPCAGSES